jgi:Family of unknown function (DUF5989)
MPSHQQTSDQFSHRPLARSRKAIRVHNSLSGQRCVFLRVSKKCWLLPIFLVSIMFGALIVLSEGSVVALYSEW